MANKQTFNIPFKIDKDLIISVEELKRLYLFGIPLKDKDGKEFPDSSIIFFIKSATEQLENWLNIKFRRQVYTERKDYLIDEYRNWGFIKTTYPVAKPLSMDGYIANVKQIKYPKEWLSIKTQSDEKFYQRIINIIPAFGNAQVNSVIYYGFAPHVGLWGSSSIPNYWEISYETGFINIPHDIINFIGKLASVFILPQASNNLISPGLSSQSLSIDGLSQAVTSTRSSNSVDFQGRIKNYTDELASEKLRLRQFYKDFAFTVC